MTPCVLTVLSLLPAASVQAETPAESAEAKALEAVAAGTAKSLKSLAGTLSSLKPEVRRKLPVKVRDGVVEFRYDGEFRPEIFNPAGFEYVIGDETKSHECFLTVSKAELKRLQKLGAAITKWAKGRKKSHPPWRITMVWSEDGRLRVEDLDDTLKLVSRRDRRLFHQVLNINSNGLGARNVRADPASFPKRRVKAAVLIEIRLK